jgi:primosomal protein N'
MVGYIVGFTESAEVETVKDIMAVIDEAGPVLDAQMLELTNWISEQYHSSWGEAIEAALPGPVKKGKTKAGPRNPQPDRRLPPH